MSQSFMILFRGQLKAGVDPEAFIEQFAGRFNMTPGKVRQLLDSGRPVTLKRQLDRDTAEHYRNTLEDMGMIVSIEPMPGNDEKTAPGGPSAAIPAAAETQTTSGGAACPKCGSTQIVDNQCLACGIVISKFQRMLEQRAEQSYQAIEDDIPTVIGPLKLPMSRGAGWIGQGFWHFRQNPWAWMGAMILWILLSLGSAFIPVLGSLMMMLFSPVFFAGLMLGAAHQEEGGEFRMGHLFAAFSGYAGPLVALGLLYLLATIAVMIILGLVMAGNFAVQGGVDAIQSQNQEALQEIFHAPGTLLLPLLAAMALFIPLTMAYWLAPALIVLEDMSVFAAMKYSFLACWRNILPTLWYGTLALLLIIIGALPLALGLFIVMPVVIAATYAAYREIFYGVP